MVVKVNFTCLTSGAIPKKYQPPLPGDSYRKSILQSPCQLFKVIARRTPQIQITGCIINYLQFSEQTIPKIFYHGYTVTPLITSIKVN
jgi:hypothetical protein